MLPSSPFLTWSFFLLSSRGCFQEAAVLGVAMLALGEELGQQMALRSLDHALQYGEVRRATDTCS
jgi:hypothetical protein